VTAFTWTVRREGTSRVITLGAGSTATLQAPIHGRPCNFESFSTTQDAGIAGVSYCLMKALLTEAIKSGYGSCTVNNTHFALHKTLDRLGFVAGNWRDDPMGRPTKYTAKQIAAGKTNFDFTTLTAPPANPAHNCADYTCNNPGQALQDANAILVGKGHTCTAAGRQGCCFITSAACEAMGLPDDCDELQTLRRYRDQFMMTNESGRREVEQYYRIAPEYLARIYACDDAIGVLRDIYYSSILPAVAAIHACQTDRAHDIYVSMVRKLGTSRFDDEHDCGRVP